MIDFEKVPSHLFWSNLLIVGVLARVDAVHIQDITPSAEQFIARLL